MILIGKQVSPTDLIIGQKYYVEYTGKEWGNSPIKRNWSNIHVYEYTDSGDKVLMDNDSKIDYIEFPRLIGYEIDIFEWEE